MTHGFESERRNNVYEAMTAHALAALHAGLSPADAWAHARTRVTGAESTLNKGCPRSTFVSLAENGHIAGYAPPQQAGRLSRNAQHALDARQVYQERPELADHKRQWWAATRAASGTSRENQAGVLDVLRALILADALSAPPRS